MDYGKGTPTLLDLHADSCHFCHWCGMQCYPGEPQCLWHGMHQEECPEYSWEHRWLARAFIERYTRLCGEPPTERDFRAAGTLAKQRPYSPSALVTAILLSLWVKPKQKEGE